MFPDLMVDIETTGTDPVFNAMIQICAIRFDYDTSAIGPVFVASMHIPYSRHWDEGAREWWMDRLETYEKVTANARPAEQVWPEFIAWLQATSPALAIDQRLWAKPISFEWPFLQSYCRQFGGDMPFHYRNAVDLNSFTRGLGAHPGGLPLDKKIEFEGTPHDAVDDVLHQIKVALMARHLIGAKTEA